MQGVDIGTELDIKRLIEEGEALLRNNDLKKAKTVFEDLLKLDQENRSVLFNLGKIYFNLNDIKNSAKYFKKCIELDKTDSESYFYLGRSCLILGLNDEGETFLNEAYKLNRDSEEIPLFLCDHYIKAKNTKRIDDLYDFVAVSSNIELLNKVGNYYLSIEESPLPASP